MENLRNGILEKFLLNLKKRVIHQKEAFLLSDLLDDIKRLTIENGFEDTLITNTRTLKRKIAERFPGYISFYNKGKYLIVPWSDMNSCEYSVAVLR